MTNFGFYTFWSNPQHSAEDYKAAVLDCLGALGPETKVNITTPGDRYWMIVVAGRMLSPAQKKDLELRGLIDPKLDPFKPGWEQSFSRKSPSAPTAVARTTRSIEAGSHVEFESIDQIPYDIVGNLGLGASANVEKVRDKTTGRVYARKIYRNVLTRKAEEVKRRFHHEAKVMQKLGTHHHIVRVHATYIFKRELALILDPVADGGDLAHFLNEHRDGHAADPQCLDPRRIEHSAILNKAFGCLAMGLAFIHEKTVRHKDIKPQNILVHRGSVLYTDFGIAHDATESGHSTTTGNPEAFTRRYVAPEVVAYGSRNSKSDVFSLGCVYLEVLAALSPDDRVLEELVDGPFHEKLERLSEDKFPLWSGPIPLSTALSMLKHDPLDRPSALDVAGTFMELRISSASPWFCDQCEEAGLVKALAPTETGTIDG